MFMHYLFIGFALPAVVSLLQCEFESKLALPDLMLTRIANGSKFVSHPQSEDL